MAISLDSSIHRRALIRAGDPKIHRGFTLIEVIVVIAIIGMVSAAAMLALPDSDATQLRRESERLALVLEAGRAQSQSMEKALIWIAADNPQTPEREDFYITAVLAQSTTDPSASTAPSAQEQTGYRWLDEGSVVSVHITNAQGQTQPTLALGPEAFISPHRITLRRNDQQLTLVTNGLSPFEIEESGSS